MICNHHEAKQLLFMLGRHSPDAIWMVSPDWSEVKFVGDAYEDIYNRPIPSPEDEAVEFLQSVHPDDREKVEEVFDQLSNEQSVDIEYRTNPAEGSERHVWVKAEPIYSESGEFVAIGGFSRDFTQRKKHEEQIARKNDRLERFASIISHDLRNPLNVASGKLELAKQDIEHEYLDEVTKSLSRMEEIIAETLTLAKQGKTVAKTEATELRSLANECWADVATADATLSITADISVYCDPGRIKHVFENLFRNAIEHNDRSVTIEVGSIEKLQLSTRGSDGNRYEGFYVADDGDGIPESDRVAVFDTEYSTGGTGLGLPIVQDIIQAHGWSIDVVESETGGARFNITGVDTVG